MTRCLLWLARAVLLWLLGRSPATRPRRALAWGLAVTACALLVEAGLLGSGLAAGWWLVAHLAALVWAAGAPLALAVALLAGVRHALRCVAPPAFLPGHAPSWGAAASSDTRTAGDPVPSGASPPGSSDSPPGAAGRPGTGPAVSPGAVAAGIRDRKMTEDVARGVPASEVPEPRSSADDPLVADAAWLEAHWAAEANGAEAAASSASRPS
jgi:hypothetical protein